MTTIDQHSGQSIHKQPDPDRALVHQVLAGEDQAFEVLFNKYNEPLVFWIWIRIKPSGLTMEDAHNLAADTWIKAIDELNNFAPDRASFKYWLTNLMAKRIYINYVRKKTRRDQIQREQNLLEIADIQYGSNIETHIDKKLRLEQAWQGLNPLDQQLIHAYYVEKKKLTEVAIEFHMTDGQARGRIARAKDKLRKALNHS